MIINTVNSDTNLVYNNEYREGKYLYYDNVYFNL